MTAATRWRRQVTAALTWYGRQARLVTVELVHPVRRTVRDLVDDSAPAMVELVATQEQVLLGVPLEEVRSPAA